MTVPLSGLGLPWTAGSGPLSEDARQRLIDHGITARPHWVGATTGQTKESRSYAEVTANGGGCGC